MPASLNIARKANSFTLRRHKDRQRKRNTKNLQNKENVGIVAALEESKVDYKPRNKKHEKKLRKRIVVKDAATGELKPAFQVNNMSLD